MTADLVVKNIGNLYTLEGPVPRRGRELGQQKRYQKAALAIKDGVFCGVGNSIDVLTQWDGFKEFDAGGACVIPAFVDSHTHLVFAGNRADEYEMRLTGQTYETIMKAGGGIANSVKATREATDAQMYEQSARRMQDMITHGTTTFEIKSGYGLDVDTEVRQLEMAKLLGKNFGVTVKTTFLGAHSFPKEYTHEEYFDLLTGEMLDACKPLADFIDVFCDKGVFTNQETEMIVNHSGMPCRLHCDELADTGGAALAASLGAKSADHLINTSDEGFKAMAQSGTVATFLPGTSFFLNKPYARVRRAIELGCIVALSTDRNPGSCTIQSIPHVIGLACMMYGMTPAEALTATTINAAYSLRVHDSVGSIEIGKKADFLVLGGDSFNVLPYEFSNNPIRNVFISGKEVR
ncbi:MAG: imidazolonepropionase [Caldisericia bacterium]|nr:imidazolonepropionase [Caldisericia bacterium]